MDRYDFDCQKCGRNIGDAFYVEPEWYRCSQESKEYSLLQGVFFEHLKSQGNIVRFNDEGEITCDNLPSNPINVEELERTIKDFVDGDLKSLSYHNHMFIHLDEEEGKALFSEDGDAFDDANYERAGIKKHKIKGRGRGRLGYTFDTKCAEELRFKCYVCDSDLEKVVADQHPGGHWGIRGVRMPGMMG